MKRKIWFVSIVLLSLILLAWCQKKLNISDNVTFSYTWYFSDWIVFETGTKDITLWSGEAPKFMEDALMNEKWKKNIKLTIDPENAYGPLYDSGKLQKIPRFVFEKIFSWFVVGEKKVFWNMEWVVKWIEMMEGSEYVLFEMNPRQTWDVLKYEIQVLDK